MIWRSCSWRNVIAGSACIGWIRHDFMWLCMCEMCVLWPDFYHSPLISQIRKPQPNYPLPSPLSHFLPLPPTLCPSPGKLLFSVSFLVFLLMLILLGKGFTVTRWALCLCVHVLFHYTAVVCVPVFIQACHIFCGCFYAGNVTHCQHLLLTWWCWVTGVKKSVRMLFLVMWGSTWYV